MKFTVYTNAYARRFPEGMRALSSGFVTIIKEQKTGREIFKSVHINNLVTALRETTGWHIKKTPRDSFSFPGLRVFEVDSIIDAIELARKAQSDHDNRRGIWEGVKE